MLVFITKFIFDAFFLITIGATETTMIKVHKLVKPVAAICRIVMEATQGNDIISNPRFTKKRPTADYDPEVESTPHEGLLLACITLNKKVPIELVLDQDTRTYSMRRAHPWVCETVAELYLENTAHLTAFTIGLRYEPLVELIARKYVDLTGKSANTWVKPPFGFPIKTDYRTSEREGIGTIASRTRGMIKQVGIEDAARVWEKLRSPRDWESIDHGSLENVVAYLTESK